MSYLSERYCTHVTDVLGIFARLLENVADAQNTLAVECDNELDHLVSQQLFRHVKRACDGLELFLKHHDPSGYVEPPHLVLLPPVTQL